MLRSLVSLFILLYLRRSSCVEEYNLGNALNSIENRQRLLASHSYNKDSERGTYKIDDDSLMYLSDTQPTYEAPYHNRFLLGKPKASAHSYEDEYEPSLETDEYQKALNERLLDQLALDMFSGEVDLPQQRPQKKSFFREREINDVSDSLQDLQPDQSEDEAFAPGFKSKPAPYSPHRRVSQPHELEDDADENYLTNGVDPSSSSWRNYDSQAEGWRNGDPPETFGRDELDAFFKYLVKDRGHYADDDNFDGGEAEEEEEEDDYSRETYRNENRDRDRSKRYWLGSDHRRASQIRKRSTSTEEKPKSSSSSTSNSNRTSVSERFALNATSARPSNTTTTTTTTILKRHPDEKGQAEVAIDLKSLKPLNIKKKSIDWSNYFGVDKRQKKSKAKEPAKSDVLLDQYIQSYILQSVRDSAFNNPGGGGGGGSADYGRRYPKRTTTNQREYGDRRTADDLRSAEDTIIDHVLKYTGAHQGVTDPQALRRYKERVINELGAAYSLEKLRNQMDPKYQLRMKRQHQHADNKRVATKKENANLFPADVDIFRIKPNDTKTRVPGGYNFQNPQTSRFRECAVLDVFIYECSIISEQEVRDYNHSLVPACAFHKLCNVCREPRDVCAAGFFQRVSGICWKNAIPNCFDRAEAVMDFLQRQVEKSYSLKQCDPCLRDLLSGRNNILESEE